MIQEEEFTNAFNWFLVVITENLGIHETLLPTSSPDAKNIKSIFAN